MGIYRVNTISHLQTFHTEVTEEGCHNKQNEPSPALETYAAALSGGPVGPSDHIGMANKMLIMGTWLVKALLIAAVQELKMH